MILILIACVGGIMGGGVGGRVHGDTHSARHDIPQQGLHVHESSPLTPLLKLPLRLAGIQSLSITFKIKASVQFSPSDCIKKREYSLIRDNLSYY